MSLSSNTLIHLTNEKEALIGILKEGFKIKYCLEHLTTIKGTVNAAYPIVSFSDIPLSQLGAQIDSYGNYGIGLKKGWAKENGLNPVLYLDDNSSLGATIRTEFREMVVSSEKGELDNKFKEIAVEILGYCKNYEGKLNTKKVKIEKYRFSDEREWRYLANKEELENNPSMIVGKDYNTTEKKDKANSKIKDIKLNFKAEDINYIFVQNENEIEEIINIIRAYNSNQPFKNVERLISRILTTDQIKTDI
ncbi:abortive infection system antitoxin AbiGi family protein [Polaribacter sp. PL03]|uniref:abortive infection system antitoxin AbiGi family protein n=1 Tax=Polaribacter sp. PL03 TaxID=3088353 RepID=UPI0029D21F85|nr:abortive infection system antitoxin AbiGi family protein [Polaribacter sp. PL03]MDX6748119.1 abortive infection system antitoxin AbiGi family protein [Polaribacter sp. PL03]